MTGKTYPKDFERYWARAWPHIENSFLSWTGNAYSEEANIKKIIFNSYRAGVRHTNGEHDRARSRYRFRQRKRTREHSSFELGA